MKSGAVLVDIAIDQGGCFEDSRPTTHDDPTFAVHDTLFYCVANMPSAVPKTSTFALTNATMPYVLEARRPAAGEAACRSDPALAKGLSTHDGALLSQQVATTWACRSPNRPTCWPDRCATGYLVAARLVDDVGRRARRSRFLERVPAHSWHPVGSSPLASPPARIG